MADNFQHMFTRGDGLDLLMSNDEKYDSIFDEDECCKEAANIYSSAQIYTHENVQDEGPSVDAILTDAIDKTVKDAYDNTSDGDIVTMAADDIHDEMDIVEIDTEFGDVIDAVMNSN